MRWLQRNSVVSTAGNAAAPLSSDRTKSTIRSSFAALVSGNKSGTATPSKSEKAHRRRRRQGRRRRASSSSSEFDSISDEDASWESDDGDSDYEDDNSRPRHRQRRGRKRRHGRRRRDESSSVSSMSSDDDAGTLLELRDLTSRELRKKCKRLGLDASSCVDKVDLIALIREHYRLTSADARRVSSAFGGAAAAMGRAVGGGPYYGALQHDETQQMMEVLHEIVPFFGQGDGASDAVVLETINRLPPHATEVPDDYGNTILMTACQVGAFELVPLLTSKGSNANARNQDGATCLHFSCYADSFSPETAELLIDQGAIAEVVEDKFGCTPLHWAASSGDIRLCSLLCSAGACPTTLDNNGCDPIMYAKQGNKLECAQYLESIARSAVADEKRGDSGVPAGHEMRGDLPNWEELTDTNTGCKYYHNRLTGHSLWEDEYRKLKQKAAEEDGGETASEIPQPAISKTPIKRASPSENDHSSGRPSAQTPRGTDQAPSETKEEESRVESNSVKEFCEPSSSSSTSSDDDSALAKKSDQVPKASNTSSAIRQDRIGKAPTVALASGPPGSFAQNNGNNMATKAPTTSSTMLESKTHDFDDGSTSGSGLSAKRHWSSEEKKEENATAPIFSTSVVGFHAEEDLSEDDCSSSSVYARRMRRRREKKQGPQRTRLPFGRSSASRSNKHSSSSRGKRDKSSSARRPLDMSPVSSSPITVSKETFEERLAALQSKMEGQLSAQLQKMEEKMSASQVQKETTSPKTKENLSEMSAKVIQLQADVATKDLEILSLKRDIVGLQTKLASISHRPKTPVAVQSKDAMVGDGDVTEGDRASTVSTEHLENELAGSNAKIEELTFKVSATEKELLLVEQKQKRVEKQATTAEEALQREREAKEEIIHLLEQTQKGAEVGAELAQSMREEKERNADTIRRLENDLKSLETSSEVELANLSSVIEEKTRLLTSERNQVSHLTEELEESKRQHDDELARVKREQVEEVESIKSSLNRNHAIELDSVQSELKEERLLRMEKEVERNDAIQSMEDAFQRTRVAEAKLQEMTDMIKEAKVLVGVNERLHKALHVETDRRKVLHNKLEDLKGRIRVYVRIRPLSNTERGRRCSDVLNKEDQRTCVMLPGGEKMKEAKSWEFDQIFCGGIDDGNTQDSVFKDTRLLVTSAVDGFNVCIFAYGQTGSGKTYTMFGAGGIGPEMGLDGSMNEHCGLAPRAAAELFRVLQEKEASSKTSIHVTMFELYNDGLRDLLCTDDADPVPLKIKLAEHSDTGMVEVEGAVREDVESASDLLALFKRGSEFRTTASTQMNADSSRSHLITSIVSTVKNKRTGRVVRGKLTLVDLAGSERVSKSGATGHQLKEAQSINKSLSALGDVIGALTSGHKHIPYRNHPLTMLMSDSIGGNAKTLMFLCCSPADYNRSETANSLDFAQRCKNCVNVVSKDSSSASHVSQVRALRAELARMKKGATGSKRRVVARRPGM